MNDVIVWSGWIGGIAIGLYMLLQYWFTGIALGCSGAYCNPLAPFSRLRFFRATDYGRFNNWRLWFSLGLPIGGALGVLTSPEATWQISFSMGEKYESVLPQDPWARVALLFTGGTLMGFGARQAGGCTSGHVISGLSFFNPSSFIAAVMFFIGGLVTVQVMFALLA